MSLLNKKKKTGWTGWQVHAGEAPDYRSFWQWSVEGYTAKVKQDSAQSNWWTATLHKDGKQIWRKRVKAKTPNPAKQRVARKLRQLLLPRPL